MRRLKEDDTFIDDLLSRLAKEREKSEILLGAVQHAAPKVRYYDTILQCPRAVQVSIVASDYGMSAIAFNRLLHQLQIQFRVGKTWILYRKYAGRGYTTTRTYAVDGKITSIHTYFTQRGRFFLYEMLKQHGILPQAEKFSARA